MSSIFHSALYLKIDPCGPATAKPIFRTATWHSQCTHPVLPVLSTSHFPTTDTQTVSKPWATANGAPLEHSHTCPLLVCPRFMEECRLDCAVSLCHGSRSAISSTLAPAGHSWQVEKNIHHEIFVFVFFASSNKFYSRQLQIIKAVTYIGPRSPFPSPQTVRQVFNTPEKQASLCFFSITSETVNPKLNWKMCNPNNLKKQVVP